MIKFYSGSTTIVDEKNGRVEYAAEIGRWEIDPDDGESIQFRIPSQSVGTNNDRIAFYVSSSGNIGIGTKDPASAFDIRDAKQDVDPRNARSGKEALLKLSREASEKDQRATQLTTARTIGGVSFNGTANINLPGVNTTGNQATTGNAATATKITSITNDDIVQKTATQTLTNKTLTTPTIGDMSNCTFPTLNQSTTGNAATATNLSGFTFALDRSNNLVISQAGGRTTWTISPD